jgi:hypothetical protein
VSGFLVDTNVVSEVFRPKPDARVEAWLQAVEPSSVFMSALTGGEIEKGIARLPPGRRRTSLELWFETDLLVFFEGRVLDVDLHVAREWGRLAAWSTARGRSLPVIEWTSRCHRFVSRAHRCHPQHVRL